MVALTTTATTVTTITCGGYLILSQHSVQDGADQLLDGGGGSVDGGAVLGEV